MRQLSQAKCQEPSYELAKPNYHVLSVFQASSDYLPDLQIGATMINTIMKGVTSTELYHKTEHYLKQAKISPMEFAGHISGLNSVARSIWKTLGGEQNSNQELKDFLNELGVSPRSGPKFEAGAWLRLSDDINLSVDLNEGHFSLWKEKVLAAMKDSG